MAKGIMRTLFGFYTDINPVWLSGANDVIVVEDENGRLKSSPFVVRFGRNQMFHITSKTVHILVNEKMSTLTMSIGSHGELFFEQHPSMSLAEFKPQLSNSYFERDLKKTGIPDFSSAKILMTDPSTVATSTEPSKSSSIEYENTKTAELVNENLDSIKNGIELAAKDDSYVSISPMSQRSQNLIIRRFFKSTRCKEMVAQHNLLMMSHKTVAGLLQSYEYAKFLYSQRDALCHAIRGLWTGRVNSKCSGNFEDGCKNATMRFSLCLSSRMDTNIEEAFDGCEIMQLRDTEKVVVQISGCEYCRFNFYLKFKLFVEVHFALRDNEHRHVVMDILNKHRNSKIGWFSGERIENTQPLQSLSPNDEQLRGLNLQPGVNKVTFKLSGINQKLEAKIYLWKHTDKIIISDIDGTITKSDIRGHIYSFMGKDWTHSGVANLYQKLVKNGYKIIYLTTRALGQSGMTRSYLSSVIQAGCKMPEGPILLSPDGVFSAIYREIITRDPFNFKISCLKKIEELFGGENPWISGFGNKRSDVLTYKTIGIPTSKIFTINPEGNIHLELTNTLTSTHSSLDGFVDAMFPPLGSLGINFDNEFVDTEW